MPGSYLRGQNTIGPGWSSQKNTPLFYFCGLIVFLYTSTQLNIVANKVEVLYTLKGFLFKLLGNIG